MQTKRTTTPSAQTPPPLWYVSSDGSVEGPMTTATLLRGVAFGQVSEDSWVKGHAWQHWRNVRQIREVCALRKVQARAEKGWQLPEGWRPPTPFAEGQAFANRFLRASMSPTESMLLTLHASVEATRAKVALLHRYRMPEQTFVTSFTFGEGLEPLADVPLDRSDASCAAAVGGRGVWGSQGVGEAQRAIIRRFGQTYPLRGVAMVPIRVAGRTFAMIEVGRIDHPFRNCDKGRLAGVRRALEQRLEDDSWTPSSSCESTC